MNEALSKQQRAKKTYVQLGKAFIIKDAKDILVQKDTQEAAACNKRLAGDNRKTGKASKRRYGQYNEIRHNAHTCEADTDMPNYSESE